MDFLAKILKWLFGLLSKNKKAVAFAVGGVGAGLAGTGLAAGHNSKKINKKALVIQEEALASYNNSDRITRESMDWLGDLQIQVIDSFSDFIEAMEKIQSRPSGLASKVAKVKIPDYQPEELKTLSNIVQMAFAGGLGAAAGLGVGFAAYGLGAFALGPAALAGGVVICVKGFSLSKKAVDNKRKAKKLKSDVDRVIEYHTKLREASDTLYQSMSDVYPIYNDHLSKLENLVAQKTEWKCFTKEEQLLVKNTVMLVKLLHDMSKVQLVTKSTKEDQLETVNEKEVKRVVAEAGNVLPQLA